MNEIDKALFGDHETAKRLTDAGVLLPCPFCKKDAVVHVVESMPRNAEYKKEVPKGARILRCVCYPSGKKYFEYRMKEYIPQCVDSGCPGRIVKRYKTEYEARLAWNTRAAIGDSDEH